MTQFTKLETPITIKEFFRRYDRQLRNLIRDSSERSFYIEYGSNSDLRVGEKYCAKVQKGLYDLFDDYSSFLNFDVNFENDNIQIPTQNEPAYPDYSTPGRIQTTVSRKIRDTKLTRAMKRDFQWKCQICGKRITVEVGFYSEGHHLKPLGGGYEGPDIRENIIILCPYHHAEFDYGSISIDPETSKIVHSDSNNEYHNSNLAYVREDIGKEFLEFHYNNIFWGDHI